MNLFLDFIRPTSGRALVNGVEVRSNPAETRRHIAYVSENVMLYGDFTARENLDFFTRLTGKRLDGETIIKRCVVSACRKKASSVS